MVPPDDSSILPMFGAGHKIHLVGAKGTGMAALAEILHARGCILSASDVPERFYTDEILAALGIRVAQGFDPAHIPGGTELVIHSAAWDPLSNPELLAAAQAGIPIITYPHALGAISENMESTAISGVHGKTTTTAMTGSLLAALKLPATTLAGSAVASFGGRSTRIGGSRFFVAETCEYRRHFLHFHPRCIIVTSIEPDHQDYYPDLASIMAAFAEFAALLPPLGMLIYCADDAGAASLARTLAASRPDCGIIPYGFSADGPWRLTDYHAGQGKASFRLQGIDAPFQLMLPGRHLALDATAAIIVATRLLGDSGRLIAIQENGGAGVVLPDPAKLVPEDLAAIASALAGFAGSRRRSEIVGEAAGIMVMDDYGHHPTAIEATIAGIKEFWAGRRLVVDFMSHTYSRTQALFTEFARCLDGADEVILHRIYPSAREKPDPELDGRTLADAVAAGRTCVSYWENPADALPYLETSLKPGDIFLTMGAGDNWTLGTALLERLQAREDSIQKAINLKDPSR